MSIKQRGLAHASLRVMLPADASMLAQAENRQAQPGEPDDGFDRLANFARGYFRCALRPRRRRGLVLRRRREQLLIRIERRGER